MIDMTCVERIGVGRTRLVNGKKRVFCDAGMPLRSPNAVVAFMRDTFCDGVWRNIPQYGRYMHDGGHGMLIHDRLDAFDNKHGVPDLAYAGVEIKTETVGCDSFLTMCAGTPIGGPSPILSKFGEPDPDGLLRMGKWDSTQVVDDKHVSLYTPDRRLIGKWDRAGLVTFVSGKMNRTLLLHVERDGDLYRVASADMYAGFNAATFTRMLASREVLVDAVLFEQEEIRRDGTHRIRNRGLKLRVTKARFGDMYDLPEKIRMTHTPMNPVQITDYPDPDPPGTAEDDADDRQMWL